VERFDAFHNAVSGVLELSYDVLTTPPPGYGYSPPQPGSALRAEYAPPWGLTPENVSNVAFSRPPIGKRGYNEDEVDAFLDRVEEEMKHRATGKDT
jgi:DivIVA domain-containing protein